jgi:hypothetical protein
LINKKRIRVKNKKVKLSRLPEFLHIGSEKADAQKKLTEKGFFGSFFLENCNGE